MKVVFDTNIYIAWIRENKYTDLVTSRYSLKYISPIVLMELWAGAKSKKNIHTLHQLQQPYIKAKRIIALSPNQYIRTGQLISELPNQYVNKKKGSSFINDILIALNAISIGALLFTANKKDFNVISELLPSLKVEYEI